MPAAVAPFAGQTIAFTGALAHMTRAEACHYVSSLGGATSDLVSSKTTALVIGALGWPTLKNGELSLKFRRASQRARERADIKIISESTFLQWIGHVELSEVTKSFSFEAVCQVLSLAPETLRRWEQFDLVRSVDGQYDVQDVVSLQTMIRLLSHGVPLDTIRKGLRELENCCGEFSRPLAQLKVIVENEEVRGFVSENRLMTASGQFLFEFESDSDSAYSSDAEAWFERAADLESRNDLTSAAKAYARAIELNYDVSIAHFNLGNVYRSLGDFTAAERFYRQGVELDPTLAPCWYNLGTLQAQSGHLEAAIVSLRKAVDLRPAWEDACFNLAAVQNAINSMEDEGAHTVDNQRVA
jgi:tetratricopeptide (TPR) repeat protein